MHHDIGDKPRQGSSLWNAFSLVWLGFFFFLQNLHPLHFILLTFVSVADILPNPIIFLEIIRENVSVIIKAIDVVKEPLLGTTVICMRYLLLSLHL